MSIVHGIVVHGLLDPPNLPLHIKKQLKLHTHTLDEKNTCSPPHSTNWHGFNH